MLRSQGVQIATGCINGKIHVAKNDVYKCSKTIINVVVHLQNNIGYVSIMKRCFPCMRHYITELWFYNFQKSYRLDLRLEHMQARGRAGYIS